MLDEIFDIFGSNLLFCPILLKQIARRRAAHMLKYPDAQVISLGIGDTTEPIPDVITSAMAKVPHKILFSGLIS